MRVSGNKYREIYKQDSDFIFDFRISNYTSNNFQVGLSGTGFYGLYFRTGIIYDWNNTMVGAFNGQPVEFQSSRKNGQAEYSINRIPVNREIANSSHFDKIVASMIDGGEADLIANFYGNVPSLTFQNVVSSSGISGEIFNHGSYPVRLFDMSSTQYTGDWTFNDFISGNAITTFSTVGPHTIISGETIDITLFTSFGENLYNVSVDSSVDVGGDSEEYSFASLALISGNNRINNTVQDFLYSVSYLSSPNYLNLYFDYTQNRTGDALVTRNGAFTGTYSGWLSAISGYCSGTLYNSSPTTQNISYTLDAYNTQSVPFTNPSSVTYSAYATGRYIYSYNYYEDLRNGLDVPLPTAFMQAGSYLTDLGGYFGNTTIAGNDYELWLQNTQYSGDRILTGVITTQSQSGRFVFNSDYYIASGLFKREEALGTSYANKSFEGQLYRGIAYCFLPDDYNIKITGHRPGGLVLTGTIDSTYNCLLFKDVPNFSGSGQYVFSGLVSGKILVSQLAYFVKDGSFGLAEAPEASYGYRNMSFLSSHVMKLGMQRYDWEHLDQFSGISNYYSTLYAGLNDQSATLHQPTGLPIDFRGQGFLAHIGQKPNNQYYNYNIKYVSPNTTPIYERILDTEFTGQLPYPITGFIQRGEFRHYIATGAKSGLFFEERLDEYYYPLTQDEKTNINSLKTFSFNGDNTTRIVSKYILHNGPTGVTQVIEPPFTGILESGYFNQSIEVTGEMTGIYTNFAKNMPDVWTVSVADDIDGPYQGISVPPFIDSASRYRIENIPIEGDSEKFVQVHYNAAAYTSISGGTDKAELSFTLNTASGTQVIE